MEKEVREREEKVVEKEQAIDAIKVEGCSASSSRCLVEGESRWSWMMDGYKLSPCSMSTSRYHGQRIFDDGERRAECICNPACFLGCSFDFHQF